MQFYRIPCIFFTTRINVRLFLNEDYGSKKEVVAIAYQRQWKSTYFLRSNETQARGISLNTIVIHDNSRKALFKEICGRLSRSSKNEFMQVLCLKEIEETSVQLHSKHDKNPWNCLHLREASHPDCGSVAFILMILLHVLGILRFFLDFLFYFHCLGVMPPAYLYRA